MIPFLWPLIDRWLTDSEPPLAVGAAAFAYSSGLLAAVMMFAGLLPGAHITLWLVLVVMLGCFAIGLVVNPTWFAPRCWVRYWKSQWNRLRTLDIDGLLLFALLMVGAVILIFCLHYPFLGDDTLSRYGLQAQLIYRSGHIPQDVVGYPPLAPLSFTSTWLLVGGPNEHLARLFPAMTAMGTLASVYLVGREIADRRAGLLAAAFVGLAPMFVRNATIAYTDIPTTFPLILMVYFLLRWWKEPTARAALLAGLAAATAVLTKQSALTWLVSAAAVPLVWWISGRLSVDRLGRGLTAVLLIALPVILLAGPWYLRNWQLTGVVLPIAGLYHLLEPGAGIWGLIPPLAAIRDFGLVLVPIYVFGWLYGFWQAGVEGIAILRQKQLERPDHLLLAVFIFPYWLAWWTTFSFDTRFLLLLQPLMAVWPAVGLRWPLERILHVRVLRYVGAGLLAAALFIAVEPRLGGVYYTITQPFATTQERLVRAKGDEMRLLGYIRTNLDPATERLLLMDGRMAYYLLDYDVTVAYPRSLRMVASYDYVVHASSMYTIYESELRLDDSEFWQHAWDPAYFEPVFESGGVHVMRVVQTVSEEDR